MARIKIVAIITSILWLLGVVFLLLNIYIVGVFFLVTGTVYVLQCAIILLIQRHVPVCPSCGFELLGARKKFKLTGCAKCPKCGALIFTHSDK